LFDFADTSVVTGQRHASIISPQALYFLNHPFIIDNGLESAKRTTAANAADRITVAYRRTLGRPPTGPELAVAADHLSALADGTVALAELYQSLFASPEFRFLN
jgi:hypothetical protein